MPRVPSDRITAADRQSSADATSDVETGSDGRQRPVLPITVRRVRPAEYRSVGDMAVAGYQADGLLDFSDGVADHYTPQLRDIATRDAQAEVWVAVDQADRPLGTVTWCAPGSPWREIAAEPDQGEFRMLSVPPANRRGGVAGALVNACLERAARDRMTQVLLSSLPQMQAAQRLYAALGFERAPELDHRPIPPVWLMAFRKTLD